MLFFGVFRWFRRLVYLVVLGVFLYVVVSGVQVILAASPSGSPTAVAPARAIVVLPGPIKSPTLSFNLQQRLDQALLLFIHHRAPTVVVAGGAPRPGEPTIASLEAQYLVRQALPMKDIFELSTSQDPATLSAVEAVYGDGRPARVILVANPFDLLRVSKTAVAEGLLPEVSPAPPPRQSFLHEFAVLWTEAAAVSFGRVVGFQHTGWASGA
jgi:hypothetical protein